MGKTDTISIEEVKPEYPGGEAALFKLISDNLVYPPEALKKGIEGIVYVQFVIEKDGRVSNAEIIRGIDLQLDAETLRLIGLMERWQPGTQRGEPVPVRFTMPLKFKITENVSKTVVAFFD